MRFLPRNRQTAARSLRKLPASPNTATEKRRPSAALPTHRTTCCASATKSRSWSCRVEPLRQQAEKAQKYLTLKGELQGLEVTVWLDSLDKVAESAKKAQEDYASAAFILEQAHDELNTLYHQAEQMALQLNQKSLELDLLRENITSLQTERQKKEADVSVLQAQVEHLQQNIERARHEMDEQSARSGSIAETMEERQQAIAALDEACAQLDAQVQEKTAQASEVQRELGAAQQALLQRAAQENLLLADAQDKKTQIASLTASMEEVEARKKTLQEDLQANETRRAQTEQQRAQCVKALEDAADGVQSAKNRIAGYALRLKTRQEKTQALQRNLDGVSVQLRTLEAKANMLREMERDFEGFSKAVRLVMQEAARGALSGVHGPVSKLIRVEDRYTTAIETALGAAMQNIIVDDEASGKAAIQLLKRRDAGRATFLPLSTVTGRRLSEPSLISAPGLCRRCLRACADRRAVSGNPGKSSGKNRDCRDAGQRHCDGEKNGKPRAHCHARRTGHEPRRQHDGRLERKECGRSVQSE